MIPLPDDDPLLESLRREIDALFRAASRRGAEHAARVARELHLDRLAERFLAEAADEEVSEAAPRSRGKT